VALQGGNGQGMAMDSIPQLRVIILPAVVTAMALVPLLWAVSRNGDFEGLALSCGTEMIGAAAGYWLFEVVVRGMQRREARKRSLIMQMGSPDNALAREAVGKLRAQGWLTDETLHGAYLIFANLREADLSGANLLRANLRRADLSGANLLNANLRGADLREADLYSADLCEADLRGANLREADLPGADLYEANLPGADLRGANLNSANLLQADLSEAILEDAYVSDEQLARARSLKGAILPDGTIHD